MSLYYCSYQTPCLVGGLDYAGGGPVHMASGAAALAFCIFLGHRKRIAFKPHNLTNVFLGTALLWMGWFGFNAGSSLNATARAGYAGLATTISASSGGLAWSMVDYARTGKWSGIAFCSGVIAGLVGITPAAGFVSAWASIVIGVLAAVTCYFGIMLKDVLGYDDSADAFGVHGVGGFVGSILTGIFADKDIAALDGGVIAGGVINGNNMLLVYNLAGAFAILAYSFFGTMILLYLINIIPGCKFRPSAEEESVGGDYAEMGEAAYEIVSSSVTPLPLMKNHEKDQTIV
jgi:Amt family ammonium transporter